MQQLQFVILSPLPARDCTFDADAVAEATMPLLQTMSKGMLFCSQGPVKRPQDSSAQLTQECSRFLDDSQGKDTEELLMSAAVSSNVARIVKRRVCACASLPCQESQ